MRRKKRQAPTSSGSPILALFAAPDRSPDSDQHVIIVLLCAALCAALLDMSVFLIAVVGVAAGIKMLLRGILAVYGFLRRILLLLPEWAFYMLGISILCAVFGVYFAKWMGRLFVWCTRKSNEEKEEADHEKMDQGSIADRLCLLYCRCSADALRLGRAAEKRTRKRMI